MAANQIHRHHFLVSFHRILEFGRWTYIIHLLLNQALSFYKALQLTTNLVLDGTFDPTKSGLLFELQAIQSFGVLGEFGVDNLIHLEFGGLLHENCQILD